MGKGKSKQRAQQSTGPVYSGGGGRRKAFARVRRSVVAIMREPPTPTGQHPDLRKIAIMGTGFIADRVGLVITAGHVIDPWIKAAQAQGAAANIDMPRVLIHSPAAHQGNEFGWGYFGVPVTGILRSPKYDLAVLRIAPAAEAGVPIDPLPLSDAPCEEGDEVSVCGYPFGTQLHAQLFSGMPVIVPSFSQGIVSAILPHTGAPKSLLKGFQIDAMINGGNSGGPVFDPTAGRVVGVITNAHTSSIEHVVTRPPQANPPSGGNASSADQLVEVEVPTGLALAEHVHHALPMLQEVRDDLTRGELK
jgi:S1-C subfamily serine protease